MKTRTARRSQTPPVETTLTPVETAAIARDHAQRIAALLHRPALSDPECADVVNVPLSTWYAFRDELDIREFFFLGRRRFTLTKALVSALEARAAANASAHEAQPYSRG
jgi:hypothetical protein